MAFSKMALYSMRARTRHINLEWIFIMKSLLALAITAMSLSAANAATVYNKDGSEVAIYGRVQSIYYSQDSGENNNAANDGNIKTSGRLGLNLRSALTDNIAAIAKVEWDVADGDDKSEFGNRYTWVGADFGQFGTLKAGKFEDAIKYVIETTDVFEDFACYGQLGNDDRRAGMLGYSWSGYGVDVNATFGFAKDNQQVDGAFYEGEKVDIDTAYAFSLGYTTPEVLFGPISIRAGFGGANFYDSADYDGVESDPKNPYANNFYDKYTQWAASVTWGGDEGLYVSFMGQARDFTMTENANNEGYDDYTLTGFEFAVGYNFASGVTLLTGYNYMKIDMDGADNADSKGSVIPVYALYQINPNFRVWAEARFDAGTDEEYEEDTDGTYALDENVFSVGCRYTF